MGLCGVMWGYVTFFSVIWRYVVSFGGMLGFVALYSVFWHYLGYVALCGVMWRNEPLYGIM